MLGDLYLAAITATTERSQGINERDLLERASQSVPSASAGGIMQQVDTRLRSDFDPSADADGTDYRHDGESSVEVKTWIKRLGFWGLLFFLVKGLLWLALPALIALW